MAYLQAAAYDDEIAAVSDALRRTSGFTRLKLSAQLKDAEAARRNALRLQQLEASSTRSGLNGKLQAELSQRTEHARQFDAVHTPAMERSRLDRSVATVLAQYGQPVPMPGPVDQQATGGVPGLGVSERDAGLPMPPWVPSGVALPIEDGQGPVTTSPPGDIRRPHERQFDREGVERRNDDLMLPPYPGGGPPNRELVEPGLSAAPPPEHPAVLARLAASQIPWRMREADYARFKQAGIPDSLIWAVPGRRYG
jgi:hypothetical protein